MASFSHDQRLAGSSGVQGAAIGGLFPAVAKRTSWRQTASRGPSQGNLRRVQGAFGMSLLCRQYSWAARNLGRPERVRTQADSLQL